MPYLVMGLLGTVIGVVVGIRQIARETKVPAVSARHDADQTHDWSLRGNRPATTEPAPAPTEIPHAAPAPAKPDLKSAKADTPAATNAPVPAPVEERPRLAGMPVSYALARAALALVGGDAQAEEYWLRAINDPSFSAQQRKDLIEDLNEVGFDDPKNPTLDDLPLILARLTLIETIEPHVTDRVNADAFREAYKDLLNMVDLALGDESPVQ